MRLTPVAEGRYRLTVLAGVNDETEFSDLVADVLDACLGPEDALIEPAWASRSAIVVTANLTAFLRRLAAQRMIVEHAT